MPVAKQPTHGADDGAGGSPVWDQPLYDQHPQAAAIGGVAGVLRGGHPPGGWAAARMAKLDPGRKGAGSMPSGSAAGLRREADLRSFGMAWPSIRNPFHVLALNHPHKRVVRCWGREKEPGKSFLFYISGAGIEAARRPREHSPMDFPNRND